MTQWVWIIAGIGIAVAGVVVGVIVANGPDEQSAPANAQTDKDRTSSDKDRTRTDGDRTPIDKDRTQTDKDAAPSDKDRTSAGNNGSTDKPGGSRDKVDKPDKTEFVSTPESKALAQKAQSVLSANCHRCHGQDGANDGGMNYVLNRERLVQRRKIVPGDASKSRLFKRLASPSDPMPPEEEKVRPSAEDIDTVKRWIEAGAPDFAPAVVERKQITTSEMIAFIRKDLLDQVPERERRYARYFTLTHLYNAGLADDMHSYRNGLAKLVNSLSWGPKVVVPKPIDPNQTIFRIDVRDYEWKSQVWPIILTHYPYAVSVQTAEAKEICTLTDCEMPYVRGDWFVYAASRPPLYHLVLQLPDTDKKLEDQLRVDVAENISRERVARAAFNGSGVSQHPRMIERHNLVSGKGAYWKSYDFGRSDGRKNVLNHPLGPGPGNNTFEHDGGEIIFNLPNGLQAYLLVTADGKRIDTGPPEIVTDTVSAKKGLGSLVTNGISCMSCHSKGMREKTDEVRDAVLKNRAAYGEEAVIILALYRPKEEFAKLLRDDARLFESAMKDISEGLGIQTDKPLSETEPVSALAHRFEEELDLRLAAAEAGVPADEFVRRLDQAPALARMLGSLGTGGSVKRKQFDLAFPMMVREFELGKVPHFAIEGPVTYLADLQEFDVKARLSPFMKNGNTGAKEPTPIKVAGKLSPKGLCVESDFWGPSGHASYRLNKQYARFLASVALDDSSTPANKTIVFDVVGDGKQLWQSGAISQFGKVEVVSLDVSNVDVLEIRAGAKTTDRPMYGIWLEPRLTPKDGRLKLDPLETPGLTDVKPLLRGTWKVRIGPMFEAEWTFNADGTVDSTNGHIRRGKWTIEESKRRVFISWNEQFWDTLSLPLDPKKSVGETANSPLWRVEAVKIK